MMLTAIILLWLLQLCFTKGVTDVPDITAIYHVGRNSNADYVDLHFRTDALGYAVSIDNKLIGPRDLEFHLDHQNVNTWEHENFTTVASPSYFYPSVLHKTMGLSGFHLFGEGVQINVRDNNNTMYGLFLTPDETPLDLQTSFYFICSAGYGARRIDVYKCGNVYRGYNFQLGEHTYPCAHSIVANKDFYNATWRITEENGKLMLWLHSFNSQPTDSWNIQTRFKFYKFFSQGDVNVQIDPLVQVLETKSIEAKVITPPFTPKYKNLCVTAFFYIAEPTLLSPIDIYVQDMMRDKVFLTSFDSNFLQPGHWYTERIITPWPHDIVTSKVRVIFQISVVTGSVRLERIASCNAEYGEDIILLQNKEIVPFPDIGISIPMIKNYALDPKDNVNGDNKPTCLYRVCEEELDDYDDNSNSDPSIPHRTVFNCWHNSIYTQHQCVCPPGFSGPKCKKGCGQNRFGKDCEGMCSVHPSECSGLLLCTPLAGCFCAPGYTGKTCEQKCASGTYGNNCTQTCGHCTESTCNIYTGECSACLPGYQLPLCKTKYDHTLLAPEVNTTTFGEVTVIPQVMFTTSNANPLFYTIQYKKQIGIEPWSSFNTYPISQQRSDIVIRGLEHSMPYVVRTILIDTDLNSYQGDDIPKANFVSLCTIPENPEYHLEVITNQSTFTVSWKYILENTYWCPVDKFEISWTGRWNWISDFTKITTYTVSNLLPATAFKFKVRAITYRGSAPFSPVTEFSTKLSTVTEQVQNLKAVTTSKFAVISWKPPLGLKTVPLTYTMTYKCLEQMACQKQCAESFGELRTSYTSMSVEFLYPLSQYFVTVSAEDGPTSSVILGTKMTAPVEVPNPSSTPPLRTSTSITVYWNTTEVCSGFFSNYVYQIYKVGDTQLMQTDSTQNTNATFGNLQAGTSYRVLVYIQTFFGDDINYEKYLEINVSTSATVPDQVQNLTVYKRGRHLLGLRWASPVNSYGAVVSFTVKYGHGEINLYKTEKIKPTQCVVWPHLFCHTITRLQADRTYTISVSARNSEVDADGMLAVTQGMTKEKTPGPPEGVKLLNTTSNSFAIQWDYPWLANGIVRSFLMNIEETEQFYEQQCCQEYPISETTINEELEHYTREISGLHAASTYVVSVTAKTVVFGPSQAMTIHTRPPSLPIEQLPQVHVQTNDSLTWQPQRPDFVNNSDVYKPLIKGSLILVVSNDTKFDSTGIKNDNLNEELRSAVAGNFYITAEYTNETEIQLGTNEIVDSKWGEIHNMALQVNTTYRLAVVQITEYCGVYNFDVVWSVPFVAN